MSEGSLNDILYPLVVQTADSFTSKLRVARGLNIISWFPVTFHLKLCLNGVYGLKKKYTRAQLLGTARK